MFEACAKQRGAWGWAFVGNQQPRIDWWFMLACASFPIKLLPGCVERAGTYPPCTGQGVLFTCASGREVNSDKRKMHVTFYPNDLGRLSGLFRLVLTLHASWGLFQLQELDALTLSKYTLVDSSGCAAGVRFRTQQKTTYLFALPSAPSHPAKLWHVPHSTHIEPHRSTGFWAFK